MWDKTPRLIAKLVEMERGWRYGTYRVRMESIIGFLVYVSSTYRYTTLYLKGVYLTMGSWRPYREEEEWRLIGQ